MRRCVRMTIAVCLLAAPGCGRGSATKEIVATMVAKKAIPAGTVIDDHSALFAIGEAAIEKGKEPQDAFLWGYAPLIEGRIVKNELASGQVVKWEDIVEVDGLVWHPPTNEW